MNRGTLWAFFVIPGLVGLASSFALGGCVRAPRQTPAEGAPRTSPSRGPSATATPAPPSAPSGPRFPPGVPSEVGLSIAAVLEVTLPAHLGRSEIARTKLRRLAGSSPAWLALDDHAPRPFVAAELELSRLLDEDEEMAPGQHRLVAVRRDPSGYVVQEREFSLDTNEGPRNASGCLLLAPRGTFNGPLAADAIDIVVLPLGRAPRRVRLGLGAALGPSTTTLAEFRTGRAIVFRPAPLPSGDFQVAVDCLAEGDVSISRFVRTITVNRELLPLEPRP